MALGAFLAGMVVGRSEYSLRAASDALPMRDAFAVLFFVSVGMLFDPSALLDAPALIARRAGDRAGRQAARRAGRSCGRCGYPFGVGADRRGRPGADRRVLVHPLDARPRAGPADAGRDQHAGGGVDRLDRRQPAALPRDRADRAMAAGAADACGRASTARRRRAGRRPQDQPHVARRRRATAPWSSATARPAAPSSRLLRENGIAPTVVELNIETVRALRDAGIDAVYGDATRPETLEAAGVAASAKPDPRRRPAWPTAPR